jgi:hypothetical protein
VIVEDRSKATDPDSVGVVMTRGPDEAHVVVYRGGWADVAWLATPSEVQMSAPALGDAAAVERMLDELVARFRAE